MGALQRYQLANVGLFVASLAHALLTWPVRRIAALFLGGFLIASAAELAVVRSGLVKHNLRPRVAGVPVSILLVWPAIVYLSYRIALLFVPAGIEAAALAAAIATGIDVPTDPDGVENGVWEYPESPLSTPRFRSVPWWNFVGWFAIVFVTAMLPSVVP